MPGETMVNCDQHGSLLDGDGNSLPYAAILDEGTIRRRELRQSGNQTCRDYEVVIPVPTNILEREYLFFLCINETDHLPRETRRTPRGSDHEDVNTYTEWNDRTEPLLPADHRPLKDIRDEYNSPKNQAIKDECSRLLEASTLEERRRFSIQPLINGMLQVAAVPVYLLFGTHINPAARFERFDDIHHAFC